MGFIFEKSLKKCAQTYVKKRKMRANVGKKSKKNEKIAKKSVIPGVVFGSLYIGRSYEQMQYSEIPREDERLKKIFDKIEIYGCKGLGIVV